jgi:hypothetical protein
VVITCSLSIIYCAVTGISSVPSLRNLKRRMFDLLPADFAGEVIDLGADCGSQAFPLARKFPHQKSLPIKYHRCRGWRCSCAGCFSSAVILSSSDQFVEKELSFSR